VWILFCEMLRELRMIRPEYPRRLRRRTGIKVSDVVRMSRNVVFG
jgi:hypothetical protein